MCESTNETAVHRKDIMTHELMFNPEITKNMKGISSEACPPDEDNCCVFTSGIISAHASAPKLYSCSEREVNGCVVRRYEEGEEG